MNKLKVFVGLGLLLFFNFLLIKSRNLFFLASLTIVFYGFSFLLESAKVIIKRLGLFLLIGFSIFIFQLFFNKSVLFQDRLFFSLISFFKIATISQIVFITVKIISPSEIINAFDFLSSSTKLLLGLTFYFIPLLTNELKTINLVQKSRGAKASLFSLLIPLLHRVFQRSETLTFTILSRGFKE